MLSQSEIDDHRLQAKNPLDAPTIREDKQQATFEYTVDDGMKLTSKAGTHSNPFNKPSTLHTPQNIGNQKSNPNLATKQAGQNSYSYFARSSRQG